MLDNYSKAQRLLGAVFTDRGRGSCTGRLAYRPWPPRPHHRVRRCVNLYRHALPTLTSMEPVAGPSGSLASGCVRCTTCSTSFTQIIVFILSLLNILVYIFSQCRFSVVFGEVSGFRDIPGVGAVEKFVQSLKFFGWVQLSKKRPLASLLLLLLLITTEYILLPLQTQTIGDWLKFWCHYLSDAVLESTKYEVPLCSRGMIRY